MIRRVLFTLSLFTLFLFASCSNLVEGKESNDFSFSIGKSAADSIAKAVSSSEQIPEDEEFTIECRLLRQESTIKEESKKLQLNQIYKTVFDFSEIPNGSDYFISVKIFYRDIVIYKALSEEIILNNQNEEVEINLQLQQNNSKINYELNGGEFWAGTIKPVEYFINSKISIPEPVKAHYNFDGWYLSKDFAPETRVTELGKTCFLGDVTLYAKWIKLNQVSTVTITPDNGMFDCGDKITLETSTQGAQIYYTTDGTVPTTASSFYDIINKITITEMMINNNDKVEIKAIAVKEGLDNSDIASKTFTRVYTVTFNNGGHGTAPANIANLKKGDIITAQQLAISSANTGFEFVNWTDAEGKVVAANHSITKHLVLTANWNDIPPEDITDLVIKTGDTKVTLTWTAPAIEDYNGVIITYDTDNKKVEVPKGIFTKEITGLANGTKYEFTVQSVDNGGNKSKGVTDSQYAMIGLTESPEVLTGYQSEHNPTRGTPTGTNGEWEYVEFGDWPQTLLPEAQVSDVIKDTATTVNINGTNGSNGWTCYYGNDGYYYVKETANPYETGYTFTDGTAITGGKDYYFKLEPIQWRVLTVDYKVPDGSGNYVSSNKKLLLAEKALVAHKYHGYYSEYDASEIREFLNGISNVGFLQKAFTPVAIEKITDTLVDNSEQSTFGRGESIVTNPYACGNTTDKIFLLSKKEVTAEEYGFDSYSVNDAVRERVPTDYAKATGTSVSSNIGWWWLRSPHYENSDCVRNVDDWGGTDGNRCYVWKTYGGVVPALSISF